MEPGTGLALLGSAVGGAKVVEKILGPTAEYLGEGMRDWAEQRVRNVTAILNNAKAKLGERADQPGKVPPKVLKEILGEGSYCDDELTAEYFGGVLASSRSDVSRDDRAASYLKIIGGLSTYQIRFHYITYLAWRTVFGGSGLRPTHADDLEKMKMYFAVSFLVPAMEFLNTEPMGAILMHCTSGLQRDELLVMGPWGDAGFLNGLGKEDGWKTVEEPGLVVTPTQFGIDLWLWALGAGHVGRHEFLKEDAVPPALPAISLPPFDGVFPIVPAKK